MKHYFNKETNKIHNSCLFAFDVIQYALTHVRLKYRHVFAMYNLKLTSESTVATNLVYSTCWSDFEYAFFIIVVEHEFVVVAKTNRQVVSIVCYASVLLPSHYASRSDSIVTTRLTTWRVMTITVGTWQRSWTVPRSHDHSITLLDESKVDCRPCQVHFLRCDPDRVGVDLVQQEALAHVSFFNFLTVQPTKVADLALPRIVMTSLATRTGTLLFYEAVWAGS